MSDSVIETASTGSRRKRRARSKSEKGIGSPFVAGLVRGAVIVGGVLAVGMAVFQMRLAAVSFGGLMTGAPTAEIRYLLGEPTFRSADRQQWNYLSGTGTRMVVRFDGAGTVDSIACGGGSGAFGCPQVIGLSLGASEDELVDRLGAATGSQYIPGGKIMVYADMGLQFTMRQYRVTGITKTEKASRFGYLPRVLWTILP